MNHINLDYLRLMTDGDKDMEKTMLEMLVAELPEEFEKMKALSRKEDWEDLGEVSHKMKSTLAFTGNEKVAAVNRQIEQFAKNQISMDRIPSLLEDFESYLPAILKELQHTLDEFSVS